MSSKPLSQHPACLLTHLGVHIQDQLAERLAPFGIQPRHFGLLSLLAGRDGLSQHAMCEPLGVHRNVMVDLVDDLEGRGLVERRRNPADRRAHAVHLLPAGRELHARAEAAVDGFEAELLGGLGPDGAAMFFELLKRVCEQAGVQNDLHPGLAAHAEQLVAS